MKKALRIFIDMDGVLANFEKAAEELKKIGSVNKVWQSYNFMGFVVKR